MEDLDIVDSVERDGFVILANALENDLMAALGKAVSAFPGGRREQGVHARGGVYALRNLLELVPECKKTLRARAVRDLVRAVLGPDAFCVRGLFLDKTPRANWRVPWHQNATIVVKERVEVTGFGPWSVKGGLQHVAAPPGTLSAMLSLLLHLDGCDDSTGAMRVVPGSHQYGRLPEDSIEQFTRYQIATCAVPAGGLMAMRPLLLHASNRPTAPGSRRMIQLDFSARALPAPLEWRERHPLLD